MLAMDFIKANRETVERAIRDKGVNLDLDQLLALEAEARSLKTEIDKYLTTAGYTNSCTVILEHNVIGAANPVQTNPPAGGCTCNPDGSLPAAVVGPPVTVIESVRVTVCLPMDGNIPNCLATFGFDHSDCSIRHSSVWRFEN